MSIKLTVDQMTIRRLRAEKKAMRAAIRGFCESCEWHYVCDIKTCQFYKFTKGGKG